MQTLTDKQKHILEVIRTHIEQRGRGKEAVAGVTSTQQIA